MMEKTNVGTEMRPYVGQDVKLEGRVSCWSSYKERTSGNEVQVLAIENITDRNGNFIADHIWVEVDSKLLKLKDKIIRGDVIRFEGFVSIYKKHGVTDYCLKGTKNTVKVREELIDKNNKTQSIINLRKAGCTYNQISVMLDVHPDKIKRVIRHSDDDELSFEGRALKVGINKFYFEMGWNEYEIADFYNINYATVLTYLPIEL